MFRESHRFDYFDFSYKSQIYLICYNDDNNFLLHLQLANHSFELQRWSEVQYIEVVLINVTLCNVNVKIQDVVHKKVVTKAVIALQYFFCISL